MDWLGVRPDPTKALHSSSMFRSKTTRHVCVQDSSSSCSGNQILVMGWVEIDDGKYVTPIVQEAEAPKYDEI